MLTCRNNAHMGMWSRSGIPLSFATMPSFAFDVASPSALGLAEWPIVNQWLTSRIEVTCRVCGCLSRYRCVLTPLWLPQDALTECLVWPQFTSIGARVD